MEAPMGRTTDQLPRPATRAVAGHRAARAAQLRRDRHRHPRIRLAAAGALLLALGAVVFLRMSRPGPVGTAVAEAADSSHVPEGVPITYAHYPPSSGQHYPVPQPPGVYRAEIPEGYWVHSLQHGAVVVLLKCPDGCATTYQRLEDRYRNDLPPGRFGTVKLVVTPYSHPFSDPGKDAPLTLLAWDREELLPGFDRDKIVGFYRAYVDRGPELVP